MRDRLSWARQLCLFTAPLATSYAIATSPVQAATFSLSESELTLSEFSHAPQETATLTNTDNLAIAHSGEVATLALANAAFRPDLFIPSAQNSSFSTASGEGSSYLGIAESISTLQGYNFLIGANETFSFNFTAFLGLKTSIDDPRSEQALAVGIISFQLYSYGALNHEWSLLDFFTLSGLLNTFGEGDALRYVNSGCVVFNCVKTLTSSLGGTQESALASILGRFSRNFSNPTALTLVELNYNEADVEGAPQPIPEPSSLLATLLGVLTSLGYKVRKFKRLFN